MPVVDPLVPLTLVVGAEELLAARALSAVVTAARAAVPETEVYELESAQLQASDLDEALSPSLFGDARVVVVRGVQDLDESLHKPLAGQAADLPEGMRMVVMHSGGTKGKGLLTSLLAIGARKVDCPPMKKLSERRQFVRGELSADGRKVSEEVVAILLDTVGTDLRELATAASQLLSDTPGPLTVEAVRRHHQGKAEATGFDIADRAVDGDVAGALELLRWGASTGLSPVLVTSAMAGALRAIAQVASAGRAPAHVLVGQLGMPLWKVEKTQRQARGWNPAALSTALRAVAAADHGVKGGAADAGYATERLVLDVAAARGSR